MDEEFYKKMDLLEGMKELKETEINLNQQDTQQQIDMMQMKIDELEAKVLEQMVAFTTALKLIADLMEQKHGGK
jgi:TolA-binding protein